MGAISITMFLGISTLARLFNVRITEETVDEFGTVLSQIGRAAFNGGLGFWILQVVTVGILDLGGQYRLPGLSPACRRSWPGTS